MVKLKSEIILENIKWIYLKKQLGTVTDGN